MNLELKNLTITFSLGKRNLDLFKKRALVFLVAFLTLEILVSFIFFYRNGLNLSYNDARSHLDIGRRVVEGLKPGLAQLGSVWLPLVHLLMIPTIWNDFMWHSGLSGGIISMISFVIFVVYIYKILEILKVGSFAKIFSILILSFNLNLIYLSTTAMTEVPFLALSTLGIYYFLVWATDLSFIPLIKSSFFIMLSTLVRYDGWFGYLFCLFLIVIILARRKESEKIEGFLTLFATLASLGIILWFLWNLLIFSDPFYFALGPFSARAQQLQLEKANNLPTKGDFLLSLKTFFLSIEFNSHTLVTILGFLGFFLLLLDRKKGQGLRIALVSFLSPFVFNVLALFWGHSVLFLPEVMGNTWFNVRYGVLTFPLVFTGLGVLIDKAKEKGLREGLIIVVILVQIFAFLNKDAVTIDDAIYGASQKNVKEVAGWLAENVPSQKGFVLISAASHDAIIFSSGLPMSRFIHEGTGKYWDLATTEPDRWARWIVMRTYDMNDLTYQKIHSSEGFKKFELIDHYPFADIYQLKEEFRDTLITEPILKGLK